MRLENKIAVITGSASGIGLATAQKFAQEGATVVVCDLRQEGIDAAFISITDKGQKAVG